MTSSDAREAGGPRRPRLASLTRRQKGLAAGAALLVPILLFASLEAGLRVAGYGDDYPLFVPFQPDPRYRVANDRVGMRYFTDPREAPAPHLDVFPAEPGEDDVLIVVQGGSSAAGFPFYGGGAFSRMLETRLQATFPDRDVAVVNVALDATNSYTLLDLADEIAAVRPDAVLLYAGHNEYYGVFGVASARSAGRIRPLVRAYLRIRNLRAVQLLREAVGRLRGAWPGGGDDGRAPRTLMERLAREKSVRHGSALYRAGLEQFRANLGDLLSVYERADVPVLVGTVASNERGLEPFVGGPGAGTDSVAWRTRVAAARRSAARGDTAAALRALDRAVRLDSAAALAWFLRGRLLDRPGSYGRAKREYVEAKDRDGLPFRAPEAVNRIVREETARRGAAVVPAREALEAESRGGIIGDELMLEHLHPTIDGQFLVADAFYRSLRSQGIPAGWEAATPVPRDSARRRIPVTAVDSLYGELALQRLTAGWPFRKGGNPRLVPADTMSAGGPVQEIALRRLRGELSWSEGTHLLRDHYVSSGQWERAIHVDMVLGQVVPFRPEYHLHAGRIALRLGDRGRALALFREAYERKPGADAARMIGGLLASRGERDSARVYFDRAASLAPGDRQAAAAARAFSAVPGLEARVERDPDDVDALVQLGAVYLLTGQTGKARRVVDRALGLAPSDSRVRQLDRRLSSLPVPGELDRGDDPGG